MYQRLKRVWVADVWKLKMPIFEADVRVYPSDTILLWNVLVGRHNTEFMFFGVHQEVCDKRAMSQNPWTSSGCFQYGDWLPVDMWDATSHADEVERGY